MKPVYHLTIPRPVIARADAVLQDALALAKRFGGSVVTAYPFPSFTSLCPRLFYGLHALPALHRAEKTATLHHIFFANLFPFPYLRRLKKPVVYSIVAGLQHDKPHGIERWKDCVAMFTVTNTRDQETLRSWGIENCKVVHPGIETHDLVRNEEAPQRPLTLLVGSAPWCKKQFRLKRIDDLIESLKTVPDMHLLFLWRGVLQRELEQRIAEAGVGDRAEILSGEVDINTVLNRCHGTVVLSRDASIIKAYPHSLLESLAVGRPVIVSRCIALSDEITRRNTGIVADDDLPAALKQFAERYEELRANTLKIDKENLSLKRMLSDYEDVYRALNLT